MAATRPTHDAGSDPFGGPFGSGGADGELVTAAIGDSCSVCGSPLASDQRYCVECGERRGKPRFTLSQTPSGAAAGAAPPRPARRSGFSANSTLIAGVATLLLAMGVGLLIGRSGNNSSGSAKPDIISVPVAAAAPAASAATGAATPAAGAATPATGSAATAAVTAAKTPAKKAAAVNAAAAGAATSVLHSTTKLAPPKVSVGSSCSGAGCSGGKFTGNFFGG
jgi:hypothetical protein